MRQVFTNIPAAKCDSDDAVANANLRTRCGTMQQMQLQQQSATTGTVTTNAQPNITSVWCIVKYSSD
jgi:hypothetical protein